MSEIAPLQQACAIPFRRQRGQLEFCVVTSLGKRRWGFPKGAVEQDETSCQTALKEAYEEAGLEGRIVSQCVGQYLYRKWDRDLVVHCYLMEVAQVHDEWQEAELRVRRWMTADEARAIIGRAELRLVFDIALEHLAIVAE